MRTRRLAASLVPSVIVLFLGLQVHMAGVQRAAAAAGAPPAGDQGPTADLMKPGFRFLGAASCSSADCHGSEQPDPAGGMTTKMEYTQFNGEDPHRRAFDSLAEPEEAFAEMASKLSIEDATTSERCLSCHSVNVPEEMRGAEFDLEEGASCSTCHGPAGERITPKNAPSDKGWNNPHAEKNWAQGLRKQMKHSQIMAEWGLYDTKPLLARAERCVTCHLEIDPALVAAGHPQPIFDLDLYSRSPDQGGRYTDRHWRETNEPYHGAKIWATGQVVALRAALQQLAQRGRTKAGPAATKEAYQQAMGHYAVFRPLLSAGVKDGAATAATLDKQAAAVKAAVDGNQPAAVAQAATAMAKTVRAQTAAAAFLKFDRAVTLKVLQAVAAADAAKQYGQRGAEQQAFAIHALYAAHSAAAKTPPAQDKTLQLIRAQLIPEGENPTAAQVTAGLAKVRPALQALK